MATATSCCLTAALLCLSVLHSPSPATAQALPVDTPTNACQSHGKLYRVGDTWADQGECEKNTCLTGGLIKTETCPELPPSAKMPGCHKVPMDLSKPFPDCCPKYVCSTSTGS